MDHRLTRDVYALHTPITLDTKVGPTPVPTVTLPATGLLEVTKGYVPWSISNMTPCAPSNKTFLQLQMHRLRF